MAFCEKCGQSIGSDVKFCPSCGAAVKGDRVNVAQNEDELQADPTDVEQNKVMAVMAYIIFFVPLITGDYQKSAFVKFHTNQGLVLFLFAAGAMVVSSILMIVLIGIVLMPLASIASLALCVIGIINAVNGKMKPLPVIGSITLLK